MILITGATGFFGGNLLRMLHGRGETVRCLSRGGRQPVAVEGLPDERLEVVSGDLNDAAALQRAMVGVDVVYHAAAFVSMQPKDRAEMVRANVDGTAAMLHAAEQAGVRRFVHVSTVDAVGLPGDGAPADERTPYNFDKLNNPYPDTKRASEDLVVAAAATLDCVIVNPGFMVGAWDNKPSSSRMILEIMKGRGLAASSGGNSFVDVNDVCRGAIAAAERGRRGERYILAGHNLSYREFFTRAAHVVGARPPLITAPRWLAWTVAAGVELGAALTGKPPMLTREEVKFSVLPHYFASHKAAGELGYSISPIEPAVLAARDWFAARGY